MSDSESKPSEPKERVAHSIRSLRELVDYVAGKSLPPLAKFDASRAGPIESDPRVKGMSYYILATYTPESAVKLAEFCRSKGLEAYVIPGNNARSRRVIVLPLFKYDDRNSERVRQLDAMIVDVGQKWHLSDPKNNDNLGEHYIATRTESAGD